MATVDELLTQIALRIRHHAAIDILETLPDAAARMGLLADVIFPRPQLEEASLIAAIAKAQEQGILPLPEVA